ncbi:MAG: potassium channel family protein [Candidatus Ranarchaeia archaeon]
MDSLKWHVQYEPKSVREILIEMKNTSELMLDLAYYSVLYNDEAIAQEVNDLETDIDRLNYLLLMNAAMAVRDKEDAEQMAGIMRTAAAANKISDAAADIAKIVLLNLNIRPILRRAMTKTEEEIIRATVRKDSILHNKTLKELNLSTTIGIDVIAIRRGFQLLINPSSDTVLYQKDIVIARGSNLGTTQFRQLASGELKAIP